MRAHRRWSKFAENGLMLGLTALVVFVAILVVPDDAEAGWNFDPSCSAENVEEIEDPDPPNVFMMLDNSGSMGFLTDGSGNSLWSVAVNSIDNVTSAMQSEVRFGLGLFPCNWSDGPSCWTEWSYSCSCAWSWWGICWWWTCGWTSTTVCEDEGRCTSRSGASEAVQSDFSNHGPIMDVLDSMYASGGTPTWDAFYAIGDSDSMNEEGRATGGVMITDGNPCCHWNARDDAIDAACSMRDEDHLVYVAGLGGSTDMAFNHKLAAATGTGSCTQGDPCTQNVSKHSCDGAFHAGNQTEFQNVITEISDTLKCTFEVDTSLHTNDEAPDDPDATKVEIETASGWESIEHRDHSADGEGWYYPSGESNDQVTLTSKYCNMIQEGDVYHVKTQLACDCADQEGDPCTVSNPDPGECSQGTYECEDGWAICDPLPLDQCPTGCDDLGIEGQACHVEADADVTVQDIADGAVLGEELEGERYRCNVGQVACVELADGSQEMICEQALNPMPELCDGMDNSCSGSIDDISPSWEKWRNGDHPFDGAEWDEIVDLEDQWQSPSCNERSMCSCEGPGLEGARDNHVGQGQSYDSIVDEFEDYLAGWSADYCQCTGELDP